MTPSELIKLSQRFRETIKSVEEAFDLGEAYVGSELQDAEGNGMEHSYAYACGMAQAVVRFILSAADEDKDRLEAATALHGLVAQELMAVVLDAEGDDEEA